MKSWGAGHRIQVEDSRNQKAWRYLKSGLSEPVIIVNSVDDYTFTCFDANSRLVSVSPYEIISDRHDRQQVDEDFLSICNDHYLYSCE